MNVVWSHVSNSSLSVKSISFKKIYKINYWKSKILNNKYRQHCIKTTNIRVVDNFRLSGVFRMRWGNKKELQLSLIRLESCDKMWNCSFVENKLGLKREIRVLPSLRWYLKGSFNASSSWKYIWFRGNPMLEN